MFISHSEPSEVFEPITEWTNFASNDPMEAEDDSYLQNPIPENEHVGVDDEVMYISKELAVAPNIVFCCDKEEYVPESNSGLESEAQIEYENEIGEANEELIGKTYGLDLQYDKEDPPVIEGSTYPNLDDFKLALSQHAIKHEFEYNTEYSAPNKLRAYCSRKVEVKCPWRIHASSMEDMRTVMVINYVS